MGKALPPVLQYLGTTLLRDTLRAHRYMTVDYWTSRADRNAFHAQNRTELEALDSRCDKFTVRETHLGDFEVVASNPPDPAFPGNLGGP